MTGTLYIVGMGPGDLQLMTPIATRILGQVHVVIGYHGYLQLLKSVLDPQRQIIVARELSQEVDRAAIAVQYAVDGYDVAVVSSGDAGIYGMAGVIFEYLSQRDPINPPPIEMIPGISAVQAAAARVGAPLMHDFAVLSLSDLMTPWNTIRQRLEHAAQGDFVMALYNPRSAKRQHQIEEARDIFLRYRSPKTPAAIVRNVSRADESVVLTDLEHLLTHPIDMFSLVLIGNSQTFVWQERLITPRGYYSSPDLRVLILGGTIEGRQVAERLAARRIPVTLSYQNAPSSHHWPIGVDVHYGSFDYHSLVEFIQQHRVNYIVDAAHPDAQIIHQLAKTVSETLHVDYVRYVRTSSLPEHSLISFVKSHEDAAKIAATMSGTVLLMVGSKFLDVYAQFLLPRPQVNPVIRILPKSSSIHKAETLGFAPQQIIAMVGPFSQSVNGALYDQFHPQLVVTKAGSYDLSDKVQPALDRGIPVVVVRRALELGESEEVGEDRVYSLDALEQRILSKMLVQPPHTPIPTETKKS
ncbi:precorrin-3B C(17)-methyltransferase [Sulfobacillus thermosulfidooxidans]|uniref:precorrin-3B C(17)-methyltransferase n=1 Tax=Sulfobacillus thermosulfidooxidans TaxID=28034 RepID=UPI000A5F2F5D|nr:precorrin-3B C(17)-methyltransferase [Sulfobacillus thermosulfidooxidans]